MQKTHFLFLLFILGILIFSCQKDTTPSTPESPSANDSTTLSMYIDLDTTQSSGADTLTVHKYFYDNLKRLIKSENEEYDGHQPFFYETIFLSYNGADTLPYRRVEIDKDAAGTEIDVNDTTFYTYSSDNLVYDSTSIAYDVNRLGTIYSASNYAYDGNTIKAINVSYDGYTRYNFYNNVHFTRMDGNTTSISDSSFDDNMHLTNYSSYSMTYDNKHNPFYGLAETFLDKSVPFYDGDGIYAEDMIFESNNPVDVNCIPCQDHITYTYQYNSNGYPVSAIYIDKNDASNEFKRIFIYTKL